MRKLIGMFMLVLLGCQGETLPKPKAYLDLSYPPASYKTLDLERPYRFQVSKSSQQKDAPNNWLKIQYPELKASIDLTYRPVNNNLRELLQESERLVFKHTVKADKIASNDFVNKDKKVFGTLYEISGNAASQLQFHLTDSTRHFIKGALYFKTRPNFDSIVPAVAHIRKDILVLIESLEWRQ